MSRRAAFFPAFSNGNSGPACSTSGSPGDYPESYAAGAFDSGNSIAYSSSRGPSAFEGIKPNIAAPGVRVRSSVPTNSYASYSGTSMASPHVAGTVALLWSAVPTLLGDIAQTRAILDQTAIDTPSTTCGGTPTNNNVWGEGRLDAYAAVTQAKVPPTAPAAPTDLTASAASSSQINLAWTDNSSNETGFSIERCEGAGCNVFTQITTVSASTTSFQNTGLKASTSYSYQVRAYNGVGDSAYSNIASATTLPPLSVHVGDLDGTRTVGKKNWTATVTITAHDGSDNTVPGATVSGSWAAGRPGRVPARRTPAARARLARAA